MTPLFGSYQIKQAQTYVEEHLDTDENYFIEMSKTEKDIIGCLIQGRHSNAVQHKAWIQYSLHENSILACYSTCPVGALVDSFPDSVKKIFSYNEKRKTIEWTILEKLE